MISGNWTQSSGISSANLLRALEIFDLPPAIFPELNKFNNYISTTHGINTRQAAAGQLALPPWSDGPMEMTLSVSSHLLCIVWNDSDTEIRNSVNMQTFKSKYKKAYCICSPYYDVHILLKCMFF